MKFSYQSLFMALLVSAFAWPGQALAQEYTECPADEARCVVEWMADDGNVIVNALRNTIANDENRPDDRVYVLKRGGFYWNEDRIVNDGFHLRIVGRTVDEAEADAFVCGETGDQDCGPAIIQRVRREDQSIDEVMLESDNAEDGTGGSVTMRNVWLMGQDDQGTTTAYEQIQLDASNAQFIFDNVIFDRNDWHLLGINGENDDLILRNSVFRNQFGETQQWEGIGFRFETGADSVIVENNTFFNVGFTPFQSEAAPMNYFRAVHNTFVNIGRSFQAGAAWKEAYVANNLFVNYFWHGEGQADYDVPDRDEPHEEYAGFFGISSMPARFGTDLERRIVLANNSYWRDSEFTEFYADTIRAQPFVTDTTAGWFARYEGMVKKDNIPDARPDLQTYPSGIVDDMIAHINDLRQGNIPATRYYWDEGRDEECFVCNVWPLPEDFSYTNEVLLAAGTDDLPLGDLNWFPEAKEDWLANRAQYVTDIENMAGQRLELDLIALVEAEEGTPEGEATVEMFEGFAYYQMDGSGSIEWTFDIPEEKEYALKIHTHMRGNAQRGQHTYINGTAIHDAAHGWGELIYDTETLGIPADEWVWVTWKQEDLLEAGVLTLPAGENSIRIEPSWGYQNFAGIEIVDPATDEVVVDLTAADATVEGVTPMCEGVEYCPQGFQTIALEPGGQVSWTMEAPYAGDYMLRVFYQAPDGAAMGELLVDDEVVVPMVALEGEVEDSSGRDVFSDQFALSDGSHTITLAATGGSVKVDYVQLIGMGGAVSNEPTELPEGYALEQNYPNPFNPVTTIQYELPVTGNVTLSVYDVLGRKVMTLIDGNVAAGQHRVQFDGANLSSGVYFYRLETEVGQQVRKMLLLK